MIVASTHNYVPIFCAMAVLDLVGAGILFAMISQPRAHRLTSRCQ
jgi:hypothetical protein